MFTQERLQRLHEMEPLHFWFAGRRAIVDRLLATASAAGPKDIVDIGCGTGWLVERLAAAGHRMTAVDYRPEAIDAVRDRCAHARAIVADASDVPLADGSADVIVLLDVLEHTDDSAALAEVRRLLRPGGVALIGVPAFPWLWSFRDEDAGHRRRYTRKSLRRVLKAEGLTPTELRYFQFLLFPVVVVSRWVGRRSARLRDVEDQPPRAVNWLLERVSIADAMLGTRVHWPFGSSLVAVCRRA
jgi:SAM-dependent methyltransferase